MQVWGVGELVGGGGGGVFITLATKLTQAWKQSAMITKMYIQTDDCFCFSISTKSNLKAICNDQKRVRTNSFFFSKSPHHRLNLNGSLSIVHWGLPYPLIHSSDLHTDPIPWPTQTTCMLTLSPDPLNLGTDPIPISIQTTYTLTLSHDPLKQPTHGPYPLIHLNNLCTDHIPWSI